MATKVAINGFGRIGRLVARAILERSDHDLELVSINDLADTASNAVLFGFDSTHGRFPGKVDTDGNDLIVNGKRIHVTAERDPANLPHAAQGIDIALECTGFFADRDSASKHLTAGAKRVDYWKGQTDMGQNDPIMPAVFVDFGTIQWTNLGNGAKQGTALLAFHIVDQTVQETRSGAHKPANTKKNP